MQTYHFNTIFADVYGQSAYGSCAYNQSTCATTSNRSGAPVASGTLANTGILLIAIAAAACALIFVALLIRFWRRPVKKAENAQSSTPSNTPQA